MRPCICLCHWSLTATEHTSIRSGHTEHLNPFYTWCLMDSAHICKETWTTIYSNDLWGSWKRGNVAPTEFTPLVLHCTIYHCKTVIVKKVIVYKKKFCIPLNDLSLGIWAASGLKHFISALTHISVDVYSFIWRTKWTELLLDISVATLGCCSIRRRPPWFGSPLEFPLCFWLRLWCFSSNPNIQGRSWRMNIKQGAQRVTVRASVFCFSETVIEKVILASVFILRADDLHGH